MSGMPGVGRAVEGNYPPPEQEEIEVVVDVQPNGNKAELIIVSQKIAALGNKLVKVGSQTRRHIQIKGFGFTP